ncbi:MAG: hypothetical protein IPG71_11615 [bacterium]|nr:hypothetical protein [bacterium]
MREREPDLVVDDEPVASACNSWNFTSTGFFLIRLVLFILSTAILIHCHSPVAYAQAIARGVGKITGWRIAKQAGQVAHLAFAMLPQVDAHLAQRRLARRLRGVNVSGSVFARLNAYRDDLSSTVLFALGYAHSLATVLWSRGYRPDIEVSHEPPRQLSYTRFASCCLFCLICLSTLQQ